jgi:hypothetical protein
MHTFFFLDIHLFRKSLHVFLLNIVELMLIIVMYVLLVVSLAKKNVFSLSVNLTQTELAFILHDIDPIDENKIN